MVNLPAAQRVHCVLYPAADQLPGAQGNTPFEGSPPTGQKNPAGQGAKAADGEFVAVAEFVKADLVADAVAVRLGREDFERLWREVFELEAVAVPEELSVACNRLAAPAPPRPCDVAVKEDDEDFKQGATEAEAVAVEEEEEVERRVAVEEDEEDCERGPTEAVAVEEEGGG